MKKIFTITLILFSTAVFSQTIPTVKAIGGDGKNINYSIAKKEYVSEFGKISLQQGPGFILGDCSQGVTPLKASSTLSGQGAKQYSTKNLYDDDPTTAWVEGVKGYGIGEWFEVKGMVNKIYNGYQSSPPNWKNNSRVKKFKVYANGKPICFLSLTDEMGSQIFELPYKGDDLYDGLVLRFEIVDIYKGLKWDDVAISQVDWALCCLAFGTYVSIDENKSSLISKVIKNDKITCIDLDNNTLYQSKIDLTASVKHINLVKISTKTKKLTLTKDHPINIKGYGFVSLSTLCLKLNIDDINTLVKYNIEILTWNQQKETISYEKLTDIEMIEGKHNTYSIRSIEKGKYYIANGIVTTVY